MALIPQIGGLFPQKINPGLGFDPNMAIAGGNMAPQVGGNMASMVGSLNPGQFNPYFDMPDPGMGMGFQDYMRTGQRLFPRMNRWRPDTFRPQNPVDVLPNQPGGGGSGGRTPFAGGPPGWRQRMNRRRGGTGGVGGSIDFTQGQLNPRMQRRMNRKARRMARRGQEPGFDMRSAMDNPVMRDMAFQNMGPGLGGILQGMWPQQPDQAFDWMTQASQMPGFGMRTGFYGGGR